MKKMRMQVYVKVLPSQLEFLSDEKDENVSNVRVLPSQLDPVEDGPHVLEFAPPPL